MSRLKILYMENGGVTKYEKTKLGIHKISIF